MSESTHIYKFSVPGELLSDGSKEAEIVVSGIDSVGDARGFLDEELICQATGFQAALKVLQERCEELPDNIRQWRHTELKGIRT